MSTHLIRCHQCWEAHSRHRRCPFVFIIGTKLFHKLPTFRGLLSCARWLCMYVCVSGKDTPLIFPSLGSGRKANSRTICQPQARNNRSRARAGQRAGWVLCNMSTSRPRPSSLAAPACNKKNRLHYGRNVHRQPGNFSGREVLGPVAVSPPPPLRWWRPLTRPLVKPNKVLDVHSRRVPRGRTCVCMSSQMSEQSWLDVFRLKYRSRGRLLMCVCVFGWLNHFAWVMGYL